MSSQIILDSTPNSPYPPQTGSMAIQVDPSTGRVVTVAPSGVKTPIGTTQEDVVGFLAAAPAASRDALEISEQFDPAKIPGLVAGYRVGDTIRTGSFVDTWLDISGNGYNATAVSTKDTVTADAVNGDYASGGDIYVPVAAIPATFANMTQIIVFRSGRKVANNAILSETGFLTNAAASGGGFLTSSGTAQFYNPQINIGCIRNPANQNNMVTARWGGAKRSFRSNGVENQGSVNGAATVNSFAHVWGYAGGGSFKWGAERVAMYLYNRVLSNDEITEIERYHGVEKPTSALHIIGDSFVNGTGASTGASAYCRVLEATTGMSACVVGSSGATLAAFSASNIAVAITSSISAGLTTKVVLDLGKNNLAANMSSATLQTQFETFVNTITAAGADLVVVSMPPRTAGFTSGATSESYETERLSFNAWLRTQEGVLFEKLADAGAASGFGAVSDLLGPNYTSDGIHLSTAGHAGWAAIIGAELTP